MFSRTPSLFTLQRSCKTLVKRISIEKKPKQRCKYLADLYPYIKLSRIDKPIGTWLLFWPGALSCAMASCPIQISQLYTISLFGIGSFFMRSAGCIINDLYDQDIDSKTERTKLRPLAARELNQRDACCLLFVYLSGALTILLQFNNFTIALGVASLLPVIIYPYMKRITYWPQLFLGITFNWGCLMGWSAVTGDLDPYTVIPFYAACIFWTLHYDTIYAHQDKDDDLLTGVKSTALKFKHKTKSYLSFFNAATTSGLILTGVNNSFDWPYYVSVTICCLHLFFQTYKVDLNSMDSCNKVFSSNRNIGWILFCGIFLNSLLE